MLVVHYIPSNKVSHSNENNRAEKAVQITGTGQTLIILKGLTKGHESFGKTKHTETCLVEKINFTPYPTLTVQRKR